MFKTQRALCLAIIASIFPVAQSICQSPSVVRATGSQKYYYCILVDDPHKTVYFSQVFKGAKPDIYIYEKAFGNRLSTLYPHIIGSPKCIADPELEALKRNKVLAKENWQFVYKKSVDTGWSYESTP